MLQFSVSSAFRAHVSVLLERSLQAMNSAVLLRVFHTCGKKCGKSTGNAKVVHRNPDGMGLPGQAKTSGGRKTWGFRAIVCREARQIGARRGAKVCQRRVFLGKS